MTVISIHTSILAHPRPLSSVLQKYKTPCEVFLVCQSDVPIDQPWSIIINTTESLDNDGVQDLIHKMLKDSGEYTNRILSGDFMLV